MLVINPISIVVKAYLFNCARDNYSSYRRSNYAVTSLRWSGRAMVLAAFQFRGVLDN